MSLSTPSPRWGPWSNSLHGSLSHLCFSEMFGGCNPLLGWLEVHRLWLLGYLCGQGRILGGISSTMWHGCPNGHSTSDDDEVGLKLRSLLMRLVRDSVLEQLSFCEGNFFLPWQPGDEWGYGRFGDDVNDVDCTNEDVGIGCWCPQYPPPGSLSSVKILSVLITLGSFGPCSM